MTKQEKIQEAYGEFWDKIKDFVDENGWVIEIEVKDIVSNPQWIGIILTPFYCMDFEVDDNSHGQTILRPKSLSGIEDNNGWIKIESEKDLPKEEGKQYFIVINGNIEIGFYFKGTHQLQWMMHVTHYKIIQKPELPIY